MPRQCASFAIMSVLLLAFVFLVPPPIVQAAWTFSIPPYDEECFLFRTPTTLKSLKLLVGNYELVEDDGVNADPLLVYVMEASQNQNIIYRSVPGEPTGSFRVPVKPGLGYWMCLQNSAHAPDNQDTEPEHPDHKTRMVGFTYRLQEVYEKPAPLAFTEDNRSEWMEKSAQVETEIKTLVNHHEYLTMREAKHRFVVEQTFTAILFWSLAEAALVILGAVGQVMYFRRFLEKKRYL